MADMICPKCKGGLLFDGIHKKVRIDDETFSLPCWCKRCGFQYKVWFDVKFSGFEDLDGNVVDDYCEKGKVNLHLYFMRDLVGVQQPGMIDWTL